MAKKRSLTDPMSRWTGPRGVRPFYAYSTNDLIDVDAGVIVDVEATPANRIEEVNAGRTMVERTEECLGLRPQRLIGDTAYGTAPMLAWMVEDRGIEPHVPVWDKSDGKAELFGRSDFTWEANKDRYICPAGRALIHGRYHRDVPFVTTQNTK